MTYRGGYADDKEQQLHLSLACFLRDLAYRSLLMLDPNHPNNAHLLEESN